MEGHFHFCLGILQVVLLNIQEGLVIGDIIDEYAAHRRTDLFHILRELEEKLRIILKVPHVYFEDAIIIILITSLAIPETLEKRAFPYKN